MNRTALQDYFSIENFCQIIHDTILDVTEYGADYLVTNSLASAGIIHRLEIIGEIAKNLSTEVKQEFNEIPWQDIARTRDLLAHHYHRIDPEMIKLILTEQIPKLAQSTASLKKFVYERLDGGDKSSIKTA